MATINQLASRIANTLNKPDNIELVERAKDMIRSAYAAKIKDMVSKEGVRTSLLTNFATTVLRADYEAFLFSGEVKASANSKYLISESSIARPIDIRNDAPYQTVRTSLHPISYNPVRIDISSGQVQLSPPVASPVTYAIDNGHLVITDNGKRIGGNTLIFITGVLEQAELVLARHGDPDNVDLPIPNSIIEDILYTIYRVNFNMYPKNIEINVSKDQMTTTK